jgi:hypothetical protein
LLNLKRSNDQKGIWTSNQFTKTSAEESKTIQDALESKEEIKVLVI